MQESAKTKAIEDFKREFVERITEAKMVGFRNLVECLCIELSRELKDIEDNQESDFDFEGRLASVLAQLRRTPSFSPGASADVTQFYSQELKALVACRFADLEAQWSALQPEQKSDWLKRFEVADESLEAFFFAWVESFGESEGCPCRLAYACYRLAMAWSVRGFEGWRELLSEQKKMVQHHSAVALQNFLVVWKSKSEKLNALTGLWECSKLLGSDAYMDLWKQEILAIDPENFKIHRELLNSKAPEFGGSLEEMRSVLRDCEAMQFSDRQIRILKADCLRTEAINFVVQNEFMKAMGLFGSAIELIKERTVRCRRAMLWTMMGESHQALEDFRASLEVDPNYEIALIKRAELYLKLGRDEDAFQDFLRAAWLGDVGSMRQVAHYYARWAAEDGPALERVHFEANACMWWSVASRRGSRAAHRELVDFYQSPSRLLFHPALAIQNERAKATHSCDDDGDDDQTAEALPSVDSKHASAPGARVISRVS